MRELGRVSARFLTGGASWTLLKDTLVVTMCNFLLTKVASEQFGTKLTMVIQHGMSEAESGRVPGLVKKERA